MLTAVFWYGGIAVLVPIYEHSAARPCIVITSRRKIKLKIAMRRVAPGLSY